jgi:hypothetical protein
VLFYEAGAGAARARDVPRLSNTRVQFLSALRTGLTSNSYAIPTSKLCYEAGGDETLRIVEQTNRELTRASTHQQPMSSYTERMRDSTLIRRQFAHNEAMYCTNKAQSRMI